jgi:hypothetical protein
VNGLVLPLAALFAGVYLPAAQIPNGAATGHPNLYLKWIYYLNPVAHAFEALAATRFADASMPSTVGHMIEVPAGLGVVQVPAQQFVEATRASVHDERFRQIGYLVAIAGGMQVAHFYALHTKNHATR